VLTKDELAVREGLITSSVAPAVFGVDPYTGPLTAAMRIRRELPQWDGNAATLRGDLCEPACLQYAALRLSEQCGEEVVWSKAPFRAHENGWSGDSTDCLFRTAADGRLIALGEAKTVSARQAEKWGQPGTDQVPDPVLIQCCWHLHHWTEVDVVWVPALMGGWDFEFQLYRVERKQALIDELVREAADWYDRHIRRGEPVPPTGLDTESLRHRWPAATVASCELTPEMERWAAEKARWRALRIEAEANEELARARLVEALGEHGAAGNDDWSITFRNTKPRTKVDWKALAEALQPPPELLAQYTYTAPGARSLTVTKRKQNGQA
jgi:predicted phage-related endonuclease